MQYTQVKQHALNAIKRSTNINTVKVLIKLSDELDTSYYNLHSAKNIYAEKITELLLSIDTLSKLHWYNIVAILDSVDTVVTNADAVRLQHNAVQFYNKQYQHIKDTIALHTSNNTSNNNTSNSNNNTSNNTSNNNTSNNTSNKNKSK